MKIKSLRMGALLGAAAIAAGGVTALTSTGAGAAATVNTFSLVRSTGSVAAQCLTTAKATVKVQTQGQVEVMTIDATGLPKNTGFDVFITQVPDAPFGIAWYQGDLQSDSTGVAHGQYKGRFSIETFAVAPGAAPAPVVHPGKDASTNPAFAPVHMFHVGIWFDSAAASAAAGCANVVTPFNGDHTAGPQAMSTRQFAPTVGPLRRLP